MAPVRINVVPLQVACAPVMLTVGVALTVTVAVFVTVHPFPLSPVTVYTVVDAGFTDVVLVFTLPALALQVYVVAVLAVNTVLCPLHIVGLLTANVGVGVTVTVIAAVAVHTPLAPVSVYVVVEAGLTLAVLVITLPALALHV